MPLGPRLFAAEIEMGLGMADVMSCWIERAEGLK